MNAYVITIMDMPRSVDIADRCIESAARFGVAVEPWPAFTPAQDPLQAMRARGFSVAGFQGNPYSRLEPCVSTFLSHSSIWQYVADTGEPCLILEHDAVFVAPLPCLDRVEVLCNLGRPSFGSFKVPGQGLGLLVSKDMMPGAHAYWLTPAGARMLLDRAAEEAEPTDVYIRSSRFPGLMEFYPWPVVVDDSFSTIQQEMGCKAKHNKVIPV